MSVKNGGDWCWRWPKVGPTPVAQGLDSEMFDRPDFPYSDTFVREAIQNSLDAKLPGRAVEMDFTFYEDDADRQRCFLRPVMELRRRAGLDIPEEWQRNRSRWVVVEDSNATGLRGDLARRTSDFWNYWLNFGVSNKTSPGRGGRGIGRVTFLIASQIQSVIGYTRRSDDWQQAVCGMAVLPPLADENDPRATHAYLAEEPQGSVWKLHEAERIVEDALQAFGLPDYQGRQSSGLALVIPYPHPELDSDGILATAIEHFAPAIISQTLVLRVNGALLDSQSIDATAGQVSNRMRDPAIREDPARFLGLIRCARRDRPLKTAYIDGARQDELKRLRVAHGREWSRLLDDGEPASIAVEFPVVQRGTAADGCVKAAIARTPPGKKPIDRLFREGMSLPRVRSSAPGEHDLVLLIERGLLAQYLNLCEGKAHLDLSESKEIQQKLTSGGFAGGYRVKRLVKALPNDLRLLFSPDDAEPNREVFSTFFSVTERKQPGNSPPSSPPPSPPPPRVAYFKVRDLADGFEIRANPEARSWPVNLIVRIAYADGTRRPSWSRFDFQEKDLCVENEGCLVAWERNVVRATGCTSDSRLKVTGFDTERELDTTIRVWRHAKEN